MSEDSALELDTWLPSTIIVFFTILLVVEEEPPEEEVYDKHEYIRFTYKQSACSIASSLYHSSGMSLSIQALHKIRLSRCPY